MASMAYLEGQPEATQGSGPQACERMSQIERIHSSGDPLIQSKDFPYPTTIRTLQPAGLAECYLPSEEQRHAHCGVQ